MNGRESLLILGAVLSVAVTSCGHYAAPIRSARDIDRTPASENMILVVHLPLHDWPRIKRFRGLEHFRVAEEMAPEITDEHIAALAQLGFPKLRDVSLAKCRHVTDRGIQALTNVPSIQDLQLIGTDITDRGMLILATEFPNLSGMNIEGCKSLTERGLLSLTNAKAITDVGLSVEPFSQAQIEHIISIVTNVTWWTISDPHHRLDVVPLSALGQARQITIDIAGEDNVVRGIIAPKSR